MFASASNAGTGAPLGSGLARGTSPLQYTASAGGTNTPSTPHDSSLSSSTATPPLGATKILYVHTDHFSKRDFLIDPAFFPNVQPNDLFEIYDPALPKEAQKKLIIQWTGPDNNTLLKAPVQVSLTHSIAKVFGLSPRQDVIVQRVDPSQNAAKYVELTFRDQYVGRSDMWRLRTSLVGSCVYESKKILYLGCIRAQVKEIYVGNQSVPSGYISSDTRIIFRSESAKYFIFIQMSREMWEFDEDGDIFFERVIFGFLPQLFARWRGKRDGKSELEAPTNHVVSIVLFSRIFYQEEEEARFRIDGYPGDQTGLQRDDEGRYYQDFYKVVIDWEARTDWTTAIIPLKEEVMRYQRDILLRPAGQYSILSGENSFAFEGNVLESINLALNSLDKHYVDRDLQRTGLSIVMITPGSGMFDVDKRLLRLTTERMISGGIGLDMICLSKIPAHIVPLFRWKGPAADSSGLTAMNHASGHSPSNFSMANSNGGNLMVRSASNYSRPNSRPPSIKDSSAEGRPTTSWTRAFKSPIPSPMPEVQLDMSDPLYYDAPATFPSSLTKTYYMMPHWVDCMFYVSSQRPNTQKFYTRCKMYELQMMGIMEHEISSISIPYLNESYNPQYVTSFGKRLSSSDAHNLRTNFAKPVDFDKHDDDLLSDSNSLLAAELKQLKAGSGTPTRGMIRDALSLDNIETSAARNGNSARRNYDNYLNGGTAHQSISNHHSKMTSELSQSLPRVWNTSTMLPPNAIPENPILRDLAGATSSRVSFSLKSANGFLEESRASKQAEYEGQGEMNVHRGLQDDSTGEQANYGRTSQHGNIDIKSKPVHIRASTDDDPGFLSSSTVKPIYISRNYRSLQDEAQSELSAADSCNTGSLSSDKGNRTYISNPAGSGGRIIQTRQKSKQTYINPCNPPKTIIRMTSHLRRWQHAFPRVRARSASPNLIRSDVYTDGLSNTEAWRGLMSPASLPLTTDYFPSKEELQDLYSEYIHTISLSEDWGSYGANDQQRRIKANNLMKELIYHRLAQGFQLIVGSSSSSSKIKKSDVTLTNGDRSGESDTTATNGKVTEQDSAAYEFPSKDVDTINRTISTSALKDKACYLSMGQQVQRLSIDAADGNVEVKRYERRLGYKPENIKYQCVIWAKQLPGYMPRDLTFAYPSLSQYQWNYLDHLVSGYQDELTEELMYWRARFILIPMEHVVTNNLTNVAGEVLDDEEIRLAGFQKFLDLFQRARLVDPDGESSPTSSRKQDLTVKVQLITCSFAAWALSELAKKEHENGQSSTSNVTTISESEKLNRNSKIQVIATAIQNPLTGIKLQDRRWHLRVYNSVFLGNEVVDWLIHHFIDIDTREEATEFGKKLFDKGLFIHCLGKHNFMDGHYFYQFSGEYAPAGKQTRGWFRNTTQSLTRRDVDLDKLRDKEKDKDKDTDPSSEKLARPPLKPTSATGSTTTLGSVSGPTTNAATTGIGATTQSSTNAVPSFRERMEMIQKMAPLKKVDMSKTITIDVDPNKRSERRETAILHYDLAHNIKHCFHFQLHWLGCTARLIEDMLQSWGRTAERCGLRLIEAPIEQDSQGRAFNPFESPVPIKLALRPPPTKGFFKPASSLDPLTEPVQVPKLHFLTELVKSHGFILDMESDELYPPAAQLNYSYKRAPYKNIQYVHRSGVAFIQISYNGPHEFFWVNNRLLTSHSIPAPERDRADWDRPKTGGTSNQEGGSGGGSSSSKNASNHIPNPEVLRKRFTTMCEDKEELAKIWGEISSHLETISGIQDILEDVPDESVAEREGLAWVMPSLAAPRRKSDANLDVAIDGPNAPGEDGSASTDVEAVPPAAPVSVPIIRIDMDPASHEEDQKRAEAEGEAEPEPSSEVETLTADQEQPIKEQDQPVPVDVSGDTAESAVAESVPETTKTQVVKPAPEASTETSGQAAATHEETQEQIIKRPL
ncbi:vacuolar membrane-associated protein iml1 [Mortierella hygrophila]|uniref:Vacuolar membrane-associated protein IML1 n=1 Tax=Mortierella hygrophila TaxID=979708 RepID=A0A9P6FHP5_9FUNG|nr:vacuolar membrane-associated protein iml1 [Mortierella hygrophila]